eukprot:12580-Eustigmatos_ZCMA.PRE.1
MEEELLWREALEVRVLDETSGFGPVVVLGEVGQRPAREPERDALALDILLPHATHDLRDVEVVALQYDRKAFERSVRLSAAR